MIISLRYDYKRDRMENIAKTYLSSGDSPASALERFMITVNELFQFLIDLNEYLKDECGGKYPIQPALMSIAKGVMSTFSDETSRDLMVTFTTRVLKHTDIIMERNAKKFASIAGELFPELPSVVIKSISSLIVNDCIPKDSLVDIFEYSESLTKIALKRQSMMWVSGESTTPEGLLVSDIETALVNMKMMV